MSYKNITLSSKRDVHTPPPISDELTALLNKVNKLLEEGRPSDALQLISRSKDRSPWVTNAIGVCQLRLGNAKQAVIVFRSFILAPGGILLRKEFPDLFKANFATALLLSGNIDGCLDVLAEAELHGSSVAEELLSAIREWRRKLTFFQRIAILWGNPPTQAVTLHLPPGAVL